MKYKTGINLQTYIEQRTSSLFKREYVDFIYQKVVNDDVYYHLHGIRRIGKSTICLQILNELVKNNVYQWDEVVYLDVEENIALGEKHQYFNQKILDLFDKGIKCLLIDEVQLLDHWDLLVKSIKDHYLDVKLLFTSSASYKLKMRDNGVGRIRRIRILPITISEFIKFNHLDMTKYTKQELIELYLKQTCFFELWKDDINEYHKREFMVDILEKSINYDLIHYLEENVNLARIPIILRTIALSETGEINFDQIHSEFPIKKTNFYQLLNLLKDIGIITILNKVNKNLKVAKTGSNKYYFTNPFFYQLYLNYNTNNNFHYGKMLESLFLMHYAYLNQIDYDNWEEIYYVKDKTKAGVYQEIDFYFKKTNELIELKTNHLNHNELFYEISEINKVKTKLMDIDDLFDFLFNIKLY